MEPDNLIPLLDFSYDKNGKFFNCVNLCHQTVYKNQGTDSICALKNVCSCVNSQQVWLLPYLAEAACHRRRW
jgi:hypothetical protein